MKSRLRLTSMEIASMTILIMVIGLIAAIVLARVCKHDYVLDNTKPMYDSTLKVIEKAVSDSSVIQPITPKKVKTKHRQAPKPRGRNYIDEIANE